MTLELDLKVIHIGKCGGSTVCDGVKRSDLIKKNSKKSKSFICENLYLVKILII